MVHMVECVHIATHKVWPHMGLTKIVPTCGNHCQSGKELFHVFGKCAKHDVDVALVNWTSNCARWVCSYCHTWYVATHGTNKTHCHTKWATWLQYVPPWQWTKCVHICDSYNDVCELISSTGTKTCTTASQSVHSYVTWLQYVPPWQWMKCVHICDSPTCGNHLSLQYDYHNNEQSVSILPHMRYGHTWD